MKKFLPILIVLGIAGLSASGWYWWQQEKNPLPPGIVKTNGRTEAEQVEIATKLAGRIVDVLVREGQLVNAGDVVAHMDIVQLNAQLAAAQAQVIVAQHQQTEAQAKIVQQESQRDYSQKELDRIAPLVAKGVSTPEQLDQAQNQMKIAQAEYDTAVASLDAAKATISAQQAVVAQIQSQIDDSTLTAPRRGRIQYKLAEPGEVLPAGGRVLTLLDVTNIYMTIFLPAKDAGRLTLGDDARLVLEPLPEYVVPATVTFVAPESQFTPKTVETAEESDKLMFRVKLSIPTELVVQYGERAKTGVRGVGYVRTSPNAQWPEFLALKLPK